MTVLAMAAVLTIGMTSANASTAATPFSVLQMNLCLSGIAGCYPGTDYPAVVNEAIGNIETHRPDVATLVETCSGDAQDIADATGYHLAFGTVIYKGAPLPCVKPTGRGVYGITLLTKRPLVAIDDAPYTAQNGNEQRRRVCGTTDQGLTACVTHLAVRDKDPAGPDSLANDGQCEQFQALLAHYAQLGGAVVAAGDVNRQGSCAPTAFWTRKDSAAPKDPGIQHAYGNQARLHRPVASVPPMTYSDHDALLVKALLTP